MSKPREMLQELFEEIYGVKAVYFQAPSSTRMVYPCIRYSKSRPAVRHADNLRYFSKNCYDVVVIDKDPDSKIPQHILNAFTYCSIDRTYTKDNLNHTVMTLYF